MHHCGTSAALWGQPGHHGRQRIFIDFEMISGPHFGSLLGSEFDSVFLLGVVVGALSFLNISSDLCCIEKASLETNELSARYLIPSRADGGGD